MIIYICYGQNQQKYYLLWRLYLRVVMSITKRYIVFDEIEKEEIAALLQEQIAHNLLMQHIKNNLIQLTEQTNDDILVNIYNEF